MQSKTDKLIELKKLLDHGKITQEEFDAEKQEVINPTAPTQPLIEVTVAKPIKSSKPPFNFKLFLKKNKILFITSTIIIASIFSLWFIFSPNPERDGKKAAKEYYTCNIKNNEETINIFKDFLNNFDSKNYKKRIDATNDLNNLCNDRNLHTNKCRMEANADYQRFKGKYVSEDAQIQKLDKAYQQKLAESADTNETEVNALYQKILQKMATIKDPQPDIEKIKSDLIGQQIPGWKFEYLNEFKSADIINTSGNSNIIQYHVKFLLLGTSDVSNHDCEAIVTYSFNNNGWVFNNIKEIYYTWENRLSNTSWSLFTPLQNCNYTFIDNGQRFWAVDNNVYYGGQKYKGGGSDADVFTLHNSQVLLMSREDHPIDIIIRYTPQ